MGLGLVWNKGQESDLGSRQAGGWPPGSLLPPLFKSMQLLCTRKEQVHRKAYDAHSFFHTHTISVKRLPPNSENITQSSGFISSNQNISSEENLARNIIYHYLAFIYWLFTACTTLSQVFAALSKKYTQTVPDFKSFILTGEKKDDYTHKSNNYLQVMQRITCTLYNTCVVHT